jgi:hypothetical protein
MIHMHSTPDIAQNNGTPQGVPNLLKGTGFHLEYYGKRPHSVINKKPKRMETA